MWQKEKSWKYGQPNCHTEKVSKLTYIVIFYSNDFNFAELLSRDMLWVKRKNFTVMNHLSKISVLIQRVDSLLDNAVGRTPAQ